MSFTYCMARLPSNAGGGPASAGNVNVGSAASEAAVGGGFWPLAWAAWLSRSQASSIHAIAQDSSSIEDFFLTSERFLRSLRGPGPHFACFSFRAWRCLGWTSQATPMLSAYRAIIGAAKMHMLRMSVVGVMMAAIIKMTRME